jgi:hypothetical protein
MGATEQSWAMSRQGSTVRLRVTGRMTSRDWERVLDRLEAAVTAGITGVVVDTFPGATDHDRATLRAMTEALTLRGVSVREG